LGIERKHEAEPDGDALSSLRVERDALRIISLVILTVWRPRDYQCYFPDGPSHYTVVDVAIHAYSTHIRRAYAAQFSFVGMAFPESTKGDTKVRVTLLLRLGLLQLVAGGCRKSEREQGDEGWFSLNHSAKFALSFSGNP
jgi:hypothetical protein